MFVVLLLERPRTALRFAALLAASVAALALSLNFATEGRFFANTVRANLNPFALEKLKQHALVLVGTGQMILIIAAGFKPGLRAARALFIYLAFAAAVFLLTAAKIGSDTNYQIEFTILLILCACATLHALDFFPLTFAGSKRWITLLQIPLAIHLILNFRITKNQLLTRFAVEQQFRPEIEALRPYFASGRVPSTDFNAIIRLRGEMEVEPYIYRQLVNAAVVDPEPVRRDIAAQAFSTIVLFEDLTHPGPELGLEVSSFPPMQLEEIRRHYRLVAHLDSPYPGGVFVYQPAR